MCVCILRECRDYVRFAVDSATNKEMLATERLCIKQIMQRMVWLRIYGHCKFTRMQCKKISMRRCGCPELFSALPFFVKYCFGEIVFVSLVRKS